MYSALCLWSSPISLLLLLHPLIFWTYTFPAATKKLIYISYLQLAWTKRTTLRHTGSCWPYGTQVLRSNQGQEKTERGSSQHDVRSDWHTQNLENVFNPLKQQQSNTQNQTFTEDFTTGPNKRIHLRVDQTIIMMSTHILLYFKYIGFAPISIIYTCTLVIIDSRFLNNFIYTSN